MNFDEQKAKNKLSTLIDKLDQSLLEHPRFLESFLKGCEYSIFTTNPNVYEVNISNAGKTVTIFGNGKQRIGTSVSPHLSPDYVYRITISLVRYVGDNGLKVTLEEGEMYTRAQLEECKEKLPDYGKAFLNVSNIEHFYDAGGIELYVSEFTDSHIPFDFETSLLGQTFTQHCVTRINGWPSKSYCGYNNATRSLYKRGIENLGLVSCIEEKGLVGPEYTDPKSRNEYYTISQGFESPENIVIGKTTKVKLQSNKTVRSDNENFDGMNFVDFTYLAKKDFIDSLQAGVDFKKKHTNLLDIDNPYSKIIDYLLKTTQKSEVSKK